MCEGPLCVKRQQTLDVVSSGGGGKKMVEHGVSGFKRIGGYPTESYGGSLLLELSASDDVIGFKQAIEEDGSAIDESSSWYGRLTSGKKIGVSQRTPLMIAALYGSKEVIKYILPTYKTCGIDVNWASQTDGATALHCAAVGGSPSSAEIIKLLVDASADVNSLDMSGNRPGDVMCSSSPVLLGCIASLVSLLNVSGEGKSPTAKARSSPEKKEYPVDPSMPDIKNGLYSTDDFRMYTFKVKPCSRAYSHDWTECPFVHPGENARRRDPRRYHYSCVPCPDFRKGACRRGDACEYAHGVFECWLHPAQYRTRLCKDEINCTRRVCFFAHKHEELRSLYPSTGSALPSPRSSSPSAFDSGLMSPLALNSPSVLLPTTPPMSPSANSASVWHLANGLQGSRLKSALHARDLMADDLGELDEQQLQLLDDFAAAAAASSSPPLQQSRLNTLAGANMLAASAGSRSGKFRSMAGIRMPATNLDDIFASDFQSQMADVSSGFDHQSLLSLEAATAAMAQLQSSTRPNMSYGMSLPPVRTSSPHVGIGHGSSSPLMSPALATAVLNNSRSAAFAKRSQSFIDRSAPTVNIGSPASPSALSGWSSPTGKVDWGVHGEELSKLRKSASFAIRSSSSNNIGFGNNPVFAKGEQDVSFVQSLVKDRGHPAAAGSSHGSGGFFAEIPMQEYGGGIDSSSGFVPWVDQLYMEQEQMVG